MKSRTAVGPDEIPMEIIKLFESSKQLLGLLLDFGNWMLETGEVSDIWTEQILSPLFKNKGSKEECTNYRYIALTSHMGKLFAKIIQLRLNDHAEKNNIFPEEQCGYRAKRAVRDQIFIIRRLQELARARQLDLHFCFLDFAKAYDTVNRKLLWHLLRYYGVPEKLVTVIKNYHASTTAKIKVNGSLSGVIDVLNGLKQGCVMAPVLYNFYLTGILENLAAKMEEFCEEQKQIESNWTISRNYIEKRDENVFKYENFGVPFVHEVPNEKQKHPFHNRNAFKKTEDEWRVEVKKDVSNIRRGFINKVIFADDTTTAELCPEKLKILTRCYCEAAAEFGQMVSKTKCETFSCSGDGKGNNIDINIEHDGINIQGIAGKNVRYLGSIHSKNGTADADIKKRIGLACAIFSQLSTRMFCRNAISMETKVHIYKALIIPVLTYGAENWTTSAENMAKLESIQLHFLLRMFGKHRIDHIKYEKLLDKTDLPTMEERVRKMRINYAGIVMQMDESRAQYQLLHGAILDGMSKPQLLNWWKCVRKDISYFKFDEDWYKHTWGKDKGSPFGNNDWTNYVAKKFKERTEANKILRREQIKTREEEKAAQRLFLELPNVVIE